MAVKCDIVNIYDKVAIKYDDDGNEIDSIILGRIKWNGREPKGFDIRHYNEENNAAYKGISIPEDDFETLVISAIKNRLVDIDNIKDAIKETEESTFTTNDFHSMFDKITKEIKLYKRDRYGVLRDSKGRMVISKRGK